MTESEAPTQGITIGERERLLLRPEVASLAASLDDPALRDGYADLLAEIEQGAVHALTVPHLERLLELGLQSGRFRHRYGPIDTQVLYRLYQRTPHGKAINEALNGVNDALATLAGQRIDQFTVTAKGPGDFEVAVETEHCRLVVALSADGARLISLDVGV